VARVAVFGYRSVEVLDAPGTKDENSRILFKRGYIQKLTRGAASVSNGLHVEGVCLPTPDIRDSMSSAEGSIKRLLRDVPKIHFGRMREMKRFVAKWCKANLTPLAPDCDTSVEAWLATTNYTESKKRELRQEFAWLEENGGELRAKDARCKSFVKDESYIAYKHFRQINARPDRYKVKVGPIFKLIEKAVFAHSAFIKKVPVHERPQYILDILQRDGAKYVATDYTSFEALFSKELLNAVEFQIYAYMTQFLPEGAEFMRIVRGVQGGKNTCQFKDYKTETVGRRMSGEMCTSLGNGVTNLLVMLFMCHQLGSKCVGVVEGDDGLFAIVGKIPTAEDFASLGMIIKIETHTRIETASFCGLVFDAEEQINITDVRKAMATFGWTPQRYVSASDKTLQHLLRAKGFSLVHQYAGCPVLQALGHSALRRTAHLGAVSRSISKVSKNLTLYERDRLLAFGSSIPEPKPVGPKTRSLVEELYGVTIAQQLALEKYLETVEVIEPIPQMDVEYPQDWLDFWARYSVRWTRGKEVEPLWHAKRPYVSFDK
jgi:hypothetical protein